MKYSHILWDFDGTLFNTYPVMNRTIQSVLKTKYGIEEELDRIQKLTHVTVTHCLREIGKDKDLDYKSVQKEFHEQYYFGVEAMNSLPFPGASDICKLITENAGFNYIFTHRRTDSTKNLLKKNEMDSFYREIIAPDQGFYHKPSPAMLFYYIDKYDIDPKDALVIGDRKLDIETGKNAGIDGCFFSETDEICDIAKYHIKDLSELSSILL